MELNYNRFLNTSLLNQCLWAFDWGLLIISQGFLGIQYAEKDYNISSKNKHCKYIICCVVDSILSNNLHAFVTTWVALSNINTSLIFIAVVIRFAATIVYKNKQNILPHRLKLILKFKIYHFSFSETIDYNLVDENKYLVLTTVTSFTTW